MKRFLILGLTIYLFCACHYKSGETTNDSPKTDTTKKNYVPVADYLRSEIAMVDSFPFRLMRYHIENNKTDSEMITISVFDQLVKEFLLHDLDSSYLEKNFEENSFVDRTTNLVSFTYSTKDTGNGLKRADVLLAQRANTTKLNSIYLEAISGNKDSSVISKLSWKAGKNFSILHIRRPKNGPETTNQTLVVWDSSE